MQLKKIRYSSILTVIAACVLSSCGQGEVQLPKPRLYPKIEFPTRGYDALDLADCPFVFNKPAYGNIVKDSYHDEGQPEHPCWFDILMPSINASIHCSYFEITDRAGFDKLVNDAFRLVTEHNVKADSRLETAITNRHGVEGLYFDIESAGMGSRARANGVSVRSIKD